MRYYPKFLLIGDSIGEDTWNLTDLKTPAAFNVSLSDLTASEQRSAGWWCGTGSAPSARCPCPTTR